MGEGGGRGLCTNVRTPVAFPLLQNFHNCHKQGQLSSRIALSVSLRVCVHVCVGVCVCGGGGGCARMCVCVCLCVCTR